MRKLNVYDYLFHVSLIIFVLVLIISSVGIVESKFWVGYRVSAFALTLFAFYNSLRVNINKLINN